MPEAADVADVGSLNPKSELLSRDELNLAEFPITLLTDRAPAGQKTVEFRDETFDQKSGARVVRKVTITASDKFGLPTAKDADVLLAAIQLTREGNSHGRVVYFSRQRLIDVLRWPETGSSYRRLALAFNRWVGVTLIYENAWWEKVNQQWTTRAFHVIDNYQFNVERPGGRRSGVSAGSQFSWNEVVFRSFQEGYLKSLDLDVYLGLEHATSKRIYRFLDKRFFHRPLWEFDLAVFAHEHVGLSRTYTDRGQIARKLRPAIEELTSTGFLEPMDDDRRYRKLGRGDWRIAFARARPGSDADKSADRRPGLSLADELVARGVSSKVARDLAAGYDGEIIKDRIERFDWLREHRPERVRDNPPGFLVSSIRSPDFSAPKGFESKAERAQRESAVAERAGRDEEERRSRCEARAREAAERDLVRTYWDSLPADRQSALEAAAIAGADESLRRSLGDHRRGPVETMLRRSIRDEYIRAILRGDVPIVEP